MNTYRIKGYTGPNADFNFDIDATDYPSLEMCMNGCIERAVPTSNYAIMFDTWQEATDEEREDLRDTPSQRVYILYMDPHSHLEETYKNWPKECQERQCACETNDFMITIDIEGE